MTETIVTQVDLSHHVLPVTGIVDWMFVEKGRAYMFSKNLNRNLLLLFLLCFDSLR